MDSLTRIFARDAQTERAGIPCPLTLAKARVSGKNSHGHWCASANGPSDDPDFHLSACALIGSARMPVRVGAMSAAAPLAAALTILLGGEVAGVIHARLSLTLTESTTISSARKRLQKSVASLLVRGAASNGPLRELSIHAEI